MANFNVGATQNIGGNANALAQPMIQASNNGLSALNALQMARMGSQQGFAQLGNNLANQETQFNIQQQQPGLLNYLTLGANAVQSGMNTMNALNNKSQQNMNQINWNLPVPQVTQY